MSARGFKPVGWVVAVGGAALGCYMMSLQVATERAELAKVERRIVSTQQAIRQLETELGTRGRLTQLERWNAEILALSAPSAGQFAQSEVVLARFDQAEPSFDERTQIRMASADTTPLVPAAPAAPAVQQAVAPAAPAAPAIVRASAPAGPDYAAARAKADREEREAREREPAVRRASLVVGEPKPIEERPAVRKASFLDDKLVQDLTAAARAERAENGQGN